jgi:hypothetical protein
VSAQLSSEGAELPLEHALSANAATAVSAKIRFEIIWK